VSFHNAHASTNDKILTSLMTWSKDGMDVDHLNNICHSTMIGNP